MGGGDEFDLPDILSPSCDSQTSTSHQPYLDEIARYLSDHLSGKSIVMLETLLLAKDYSFSLLYRRL